ncbi:hypothetical protein HanIR_Chr06g0267171 [Helianthus annuus]|nr:hypothetical protein HanIR_Chr06g0267171 [Helianthus annuus]
MIFCISLSHSMKLSWFNSYCSYIFLVIIVYSWPKSPVSLLFTEPKLKPDRYGIIIWYQSLGGSFQFWFGRFFTGKPAVDYCVS